MNMIMFKCYLGSSIFDILALHIEKKICGQMGPSHVIHGIKSWVHAIVLGLYLHSFICQKDHFYYYFLNTEIGVAL